MQLQTPVQIPSQAPLSPDARFFLIGSCFSDEIASRMRDYGIAVTANPFGTMYNPLSIRACLDRLAEPEERLFTEDDLVERDGLWHSFMHHGSFSRANKEEVLTAVNQALRDGRKAFQEADVLIITLGTAFVWERNGQVVANCHKFPANQFCHRMLSVDEIVQALSFLDLPLTTYHLQVSGKRLLFTLSPIRHKGDGLSANSLSKATLRVAIDQLCSHSSQEPHDIAPKSALHLTTYNIPLTTYFPAYEIFMDELRDYRWYAADMLHPTAQAVDYVWERFCDTYFSKSDREVLAVRHAALLRARHRPLHP